MKVNCIGVMVTDALSGPLAVYPAPGKCSQVITERIQLMPGGGAANTGSALAQLGIDVRVFSKVGKDSNGSFIVSYLRDKGVDCSGVVMSESDSTPFTFVGIHPGGDRTFIHTPGANRNFSLGDIDRAALLDADFLLYQDFWVLPRIDGEPAAALLKEARERGVVTLLDECWGLGPRKDTLEAALPFADYFLPSYSDLSAIYPGLTPEEMIRHLRGLGATSVILKLGESGCLLSAGKETVSVPALKTKVVDTTGAGDCFDAGFIAGLVHGLPAAEAARAGCMAAAACIRSTGGAVGIPRFEKLAEES